MRQWGRETPLQTGEEATERISFQQIPSSKGIQVKSVSKACVYNMEPHSAQAANLLQGVAEQGRASSAPETCNSATEHRSIYCQHQHGKAKGLFVTFGPSRGGRRRRGIRPPGPMPIHAYTFAFSLQGNTDYLFPMREDGMCTSSQDLF